MVDKRDEGKLKADLSHLAQSYVNSYRPSQKDIKTYKILNQLRKNKDIVFLKPDKGNGIVILNRTDYNKGILYIISESRKFKELTNDPSICRESKLQRFPRDLKNNGKIDKDVYIQIYPTGSQPGRIYGLPRMHKIQSSNVVPPFRPIVSSINTYNYHLAKFLCNLLEPHVPSRYTVSDSFSLHAIYVSNKYMVSFDVVSLFTNTPLMW